MAKATPKKAGPAAKSTAASRRQRQDRARSRRAKKAAPAAKKAPATARQEGGTRAKKAAPAAKSTGKKAAPAKKAPVKKAAAAAKKAAPAAKKEAPAKKAAPAKAAAPVAKKAAPVKPTPPPKPVKLVSPYDAKFLDAQRELLLEERARYTRSADRLASEAAALVEDMEPGDVQFDEESGEGDTIVVERERDLAMSAQAAAGGRRHRRRPGPHRRRRVRALEHLRPADPQGASAGDPVGGRARGGEGGRAGHHLALTGADVTTPAQRADHRALRRGARHRHRPAHEDVGGQPPPTIATSTCSGRCGSTSRSTAAWRSDEGGASARSSQSSASASSGCSCSAPRGARPRSRGRRRPRGRRRDQQPARPHLP